MYCVEMFYGRHTALNTSCSKCKYIQRKMGTENKECVKESEECRLNAIKFVHGQYGKLQQTL